MSTPKGEFPKSIKKVLVLGSDGNVNPLFDAAKESGAGKISRLYRPVEGELRASAQAANAYYAKYLELHDSANAAESNGSFKRMGENVRDSQKAAWDAWTESSPIVKQQKKLYRKLGFL